jgi:hypothetical protein
VNRRHIASKPATIAAALLATLAMAPAHAAPFVPADDAQVLERLPYRTAPVFRELEPLKAAVTRAPGELPPALALATAYMRASRIEGDPRFLGYAQATLRPWWSNPRAPTAVLLLRATILQTSHQFDAAVADLNTVLGREPGNAQALLTRATVLTVQGRYDPARADCLRVGASAPRIYAAICTAAIDAMTGRDGVARESIAAALTSPRVDAAARGWGETLLGEIAHRLGDGDAEVHFQAALAADDSDLYALAAYADWLLDQRRAADVVALLRARTRIDILLLRLAIAQRELGLAEAATTTETLRARFDASHARGDTVHLRENARFELALRGDAAAALRYALDNQRVQHEAADLRILAEAASAAGDPRALAMARRWADDTKIDYVAVRLIIEPSRTPAAGSARK